MNTVEERAEIVNELIHHQRMRAATQKSAVMIGNRLLSCVAYDLGYQGAATPKAEREKIFEDAAAIIAAVRGGDGSHPSAEFIHGTLAALDQYEVRLKMLNKIVERLGRQLHIAGWVRRPELCGFSHRFLGIIVGECGDLANYSGPMKLWRRMGLAPFTSRGQTRAGSTWRSAEKRKIPGLSAGEWTEYGYNPRRRSICFLIADQIIKRNSSALGKGVPGPYYARYLHVRHVAAPARHPDWTPGHLNLHAQLLATKMLLKDVWAAWNGRPLTCEMPLSA